MEKAGASPGEIANFRELRGFIDLGIQAWTRLEGVQDLITAQPGDYWENLGQARRAVGVGMDSGQASQSRQEGSQAGLAEKPAVGRPSDARRLSGRMEGAILQGS